MKGIVKSLIIRELIENKEVIGYDFKKKMENLNINISNGSIYLHLKNFEKLNYLTSYIEGKRKVYKLTALGELELTKRLKTIPNDIENLMQEAGSQIPFIDWNNIDDIKKFLSTINTLAELVKKHKEKLK